MAQNPAVITNNVMDVEALSTQIEEELAVKFTPEELAEAGKDFANSLVVRLFGGVAIAGQTSKLSSVSYDPPTAD